MLTVGLTPKMELNQLLSVISEHKIFSHDTDCKSLITPNSAYLNTATGGSGVILKKKLLNLQDLLREGCGYYGIATPTLGIVLSGCSAILQLIGETEDVPESILQSGE